METIKKKVKELKLEYKSYPQKELLISLPNPFTSRDYEEEITTSEFTTLCPLNPGQPDYATLNIKYIPGDKILELKSLKFYLTSYRNVEIFFEEATNRILDDLVEVIKPKSMQITAQWNIRGGLASTVRVNYSSS